MMRVIKMKFSVGYQLFDDNEFINKIIEYKNDIHEVYFSFGSFANGRNSFVDSNAISRQMYDLTRLHKEGISLNLLFNATCYGEESLSRDFFNHIGNTVDYIGGQAGVETVTTTSPLIARFIKDNFSDINVRASVNMCIGTTEGIDYVSDYFDSFYLKRELNRDFAAIAHLKKHCDSLGKTLYILANSGCLNNCSAHTFHDNLVSHERQIAKKDNGYVFEGICKKFLSKSDNLARFLELTGFIRPEDTMYYEGLVPAMKLATRVHTNPVLVLDAYIKNKSFAGSTFSLLEPDHTAAVYPRFIKNDLIQCTKTNDRLIYKTGESIKEDVYA